VRDLGLLESAVERVRQSFGGKDLYPTLELKAAALLAGLLKNHPFIDGNKRAAVVACGVFLEVNGRRLVMDQESLAETIETMAAGRAEPARLAIWLKRHLRINK
jgi:death-on-curing protein